MLFFFLSWSTVILFSLGVQARRGFFLRVAAFALGGSGSGLACRRGGLLVGLVGGEDLRGQRWRLWWFGVGVVLASGAALWCGLAVVGRLRQRCKTWMGGIDRHGAAWLPARWRFFVRVLRRITRGAHAVYKRFMRVRLARVGPEASESARY